MPGGGGSQTTSTEPWGGIQPFLTGTPGSGGHWNTSYNGMNGIPNKQWVEGTPGTPGLYQEAQNWFKGDSPMYYPGQTVANLSPETLGAWGGITNRAMAGSPTLRAGESELTRTLGGEYLNANPHLDQTFNRASDALSRQYQNTIMPGLQSRFGIGGRSGSGLEQEAMLNANRGLGESLGNMATDIYGGNYQNERNRMMQGMLFAPQMAQAGYMDLNQLAGIGSQREAYNQQMINEDINRFNFGQNLPFNKLQSYSSLLQGGMSPGFGTQTQPLNRNQFAGGIGGLLGGVGTAGSLGLIGEGAGGAAAGVMGMSPWAWPLLGLGMLGGMSR